MLVMGVLELEMTTIAHIDLIMFFNFLDIWDPLVAFINSYCMFKIMYDNFWFSSNSHTFGLVLFIGFY